MEENKEYCSWIIREGTNKSYWANTRCRGGFNYLSKVNRADQIIPTYDGCECPLCKKPIKISLELLDDDLIEKSN